MTAKKRWEHRNPRKAVIKMKGEYYSSLLMSFEKLSILIIINIIVE